MPVHNIEIELFSARVASKQLKEAGDMQSDLGNGAQKEHRIRNRHIHTCWLAVSGASLHAVDAHPRKRLALHGANVQVAKIACGRRLREREAMGRRPPAHRRFSGEWQKSCRNMAAEPRRYSRSNGVLEGRPRAGEAPALQLDGR